MTFLDNLSRFEPRSQDAARLVLLVSGSQLAHVLRNRPTVHPEASLEFFDLRFIHQMRAVRTH